MLQKFKKYLWTYSICSKSANFQPASSLKMNSLTNIFQVFWPKVNNSLFAEHLSVFTFRICYFDIKRKVMFVPCYNLHCFLQNFVSICCKYSKILPCLGDIPSEHTYCNCGKGCYFVLKSYFWQKQFSKLTILEFRANLKKLKVKLSKVWGWCCKWSSKK